MLNGQDNMCQHLNTIYVGDDEHIAYSCPECETDHTDYNKEQRDYLVNKYGLSLNNLELTNPREMISLFVCNQCGTPLSLSVLRFYKFDVEKALCMPCQGFKDANVNEGQIAGAD